MLAILTKYHPATKTRPARITVTGHNGKRFTYRPLPQFWGDLENIRCHHIYAMGAACVSWNLTRLMAIKESDLSCQRYSGGPLPDGRYAWIVEEESK